MRKPYYKKLTYGKPFQFITLLFLLLSFSQNKSYAQGCTPTITCPSPPGMFQCGEDITAWLNSVTYEDCGNGYTVYTSYDPNDFDICTNTTMNITFSLREGGPNGIVWADCVVGLTIDAASTPSFSCPNNIAPINCAQAASFSLADAPVATFSNGENGACLIEGNATPVSFDTNWDACNGGSITVNYSYTSCGNTFTGSCVLPVNATSAPTFACPNITPINCEQADAFSLANAPVATFSNGENGACQIEGNATPVSFNANWDDCNGGSTQMFHLLTPLMRMPLHLMMHLRLLFQMEKVGLVQLGIILFQFLLITIGMHVVEESSLLIIPILIVIIQ